MKGIKRKFKHLPGFYSGVSFADYLAAPGLNKSRLLLLDERAGGCPAKFKADTQTRTTPAMAWGSAVHAFALEGKREWVVSPHDNYRTAEAREWRDAQTLPVVTTEEEDEIVRTATRLRQHPLI